MTDLANPINRHAIPTLNRSQFMKAQAAIGDAANDLQGALTLYMRRDPDSQRDYYEYLRDFIKELECAVKALGGRIEWPVADPWQPEIPKLEPITTAVRELTAPEFTP